MKFLILTKFFNLYRRHKMLFYETRGFIFHFSFNLEAKVYYLCLYNQKFKTNECLQNYLQNSKLIIKSITNGCGKRKKESETYVSLPSF